MLALTQLVLLPNWGKAEECASLADVPKLALTLFVILGGAMRLGTVSAAAIAASILLTGCGSNLFAGDVLTLAETKPMAQLQRNAAASRLESKDIERLSEQQDYSAPCKTAEEDPDGLYRSWRSILLIAVPSDSAVGVDQITGALAASFAGDGWIMRTEDIGDDQIVSLHRSDSEVNLTFTSTEDGDGDGYGASVLIEAEGPCVRTDGPTSDEVTKLK